MRAATLLPLFAGCALLLAPTSSPATTTCTMQGPAWTVHPAHGNKVYHGTTFRVVATGIRCATAKGHVRKLLAKNPSWPYAGSGSNTLKGAPAGFLCRSSVESKINRKSYAGDCLGGSGPTDIQHFSWAPKMPRI